MVIQSEVEIKRQDFEILGSGYWDKSDAMV